MGKGRTNQSCCVLQCSALGTGIHWDSLEFTWIYLDSLGSAGWLFRCTSAMFFQSKVYCAQDCIDTFFSLDTIHRWRDKYFRCRPLSCNRIFLQRRSETAFFNCPVFLRLGVFATWWHVVMWCFVTVAHQTSQFFGKRCCGMWCCGAVEHTVCDAVAILSFPLIRELQPAVCLPWQSLEEMHLLELLHKVFNSDMCGRASLIMFGCTREVFSCSNFER